MARRWESEVTESDEVRAAAAGGEVTENPPGLAELDVPQKRADSSLLIGEGGIILAATKLSFVIEQNKRNN